MWKTLTTKQKKAKLQSELKKIEKTEEQRLNACLKEIMKLPEAKEVKRLCIFKQKFEMKVAVTVKCDFSIPAFNSEIDDSCQGGIYVDMKEPKGYNIQPFLDEDGISNAGMGGEIDIMTVSPEIYKQFKSLRAAEKDLKEKASQIVEKYGCSFENDKMLYAISEALED